MTFLNKTLGRIMAAGMALSFLGLVGVVLLQVFARLALPKVPSWTEELSRYFLLWLVGFGGGLAMRDGGYVNVDLLLNLFPAWLKKLILAIGNLLIAALMLLFTQQAWINTVRVGMRQTSPVLYIPMQYIFGSMVALGAGTVIFTLAVFVAGLIRPAAAAPAAGKGE
ncbi:MAG: TRAP transporter small permease [Planctomycetota bacterium]|jgi:TRAP-type C4-dicarboxylate transport system permease small subunit|nr:TRAP transporter small permease [Planctomycetota bacterium]